MATPVNKEKLTVDIPVELKQQVKIHCAVTRINMTDFIEELIASFFENQKEGVV
jgi:hypothetical protein